MSMIRKTVILALAMMIAALGPFVDEAVASDDLDLYLTLTMAGVTAGSIKLSVDDQDVQTVSKLALKSQGVFKFLTGYKSKATARSHLGDDGRSPLPISYDATNRTRKSKRRVEIRYDSETGEIASFEQWKRDNPEKSKVPAAMRLATVDPLTAMLRFRHWIQELHGHDDGDAASGARSIVGTKVLDVFDGRRRYRLDIDLLERVKVPYNGSDAPAYRFKVELQAIAGFGKNDMLANWSSEEGNRWIEVIVTDSDNPVPISMATIGGGLKTTIDLRKICHGEDTCTKVSG